MSAAPTPQAIRSQTPSAAKVVLAAGHRALASARLTVKAYRTKAQLETIIERASIRATSAPEAEAVRASVAIATEGAAAKRPAKRFGRTTSATNAKALTNAPPNRKRQSNCTAQCRTKQEPGIRPN